MLLWAGLAFLLIGFACFAIDRRAARVLYGAFPRPFLVFMSRATNLAKGAHWLVLACLAFVIAEAGLLLHIDDPLFAALLPYTLAYLVSLAAGSAVVHGVKLMLSRRRPRDDLDFGLYGFLPFAFSWDNDSFPSGHAMTIFCVAVVASAAWPVLAPLWLLAALLLTLTRALLTTHFFSDTFIGAGIGVLAAREAILLLFPALAPAWF